MRLRLDPFSPNGLSLDNTTVYTGGGGSASSSPITVTGEDYLSLSGQDITANPIDLDNLSATGTPSSATFLRGDNTWATPAGSGDVSKVGTPVNNQVGVWTGDGTIEGDANLTFDTSTDTLTTVNIAPSGTVDGRDIAADGTKLDTVETGADVTDAANVDAAGATMNTDTSLAGNGYFLDEDDMSSNSATKVPSQQSVKAYVDAQSGGGTVDSVVAGNNIDVDATDPANPIVSVETLTLSDISDITATAAELNYTDGVTSSIQTQLDGKQPLDSDLTTIAGLTATTDNFLQAKSSAWASRTPTQVTADLISFVGDSGSGGTKGLVPAPAAGDSAAAKFLKADGTWAAPSGSGDVVGPASSTDNAVARFDLTTGKLIQDSTVTISDGASPTIASTGVNLNLAAGSGSVLIGGSEVTTAGNTQTLANKTLTTPTIGSFANANHNHTNSAGGGQLTDAALSSAVTVAKGGTGNTSLSSGNVLVGAGTSAVTTTKAAPSGDFVGTTDTQTLSGKTLTTPRFANGGYIADNNGNEQLAFTTTASAVNYLNVINGDTLTAPRLLATGDDTNVSLNLTTKGSGSVLANGVIVATADNSLTMSNKTLTTPTIAQINNSSAPGVKLQLRTQTDNSNSISSATTAGVFVQYGWGQIQGNDTTSVTETITFPTAYTTVLGVMVSPGGASGSAPSAATSITDVTTEYGAGALSIQWTDASTTGFRVTLGRTSTNFSSSNYYSYSWIAWGV